MPGKCFYNSCSGRVVIYVSDVNIEIAGHDPSTHKKVNSLCSRNAHPLGSQYPQTVPGKKGNTLNIHYSRQMSILQTSSLFRRLKFVLKRKNLTIFLTSNDKRGFELHLKKKTSCKVYRTCLVNFSGA
ncbi:hypothetical protein TNCV_1235011 [Trichonephila clavipes]|nr:hypothetical protein TNCV_1235011 [Trichonephila clavipes]